jgi:hypothetical protein
MSALRFLLGSDVVKEKKVRVIFVNPCLSFEGRRQ